MAGLVTVLGMFAFFALIHAAAFDDPAGILSTAVFCVPWRSVWRYDDNWTLREQAMQRALAAEHEVAAAEQQPGRSTNVRIAGVYDVVVTVVGRGAQAGSPAT